MPDTPTLVSGLAALRVVAATVSEWSEGPYYGGNFIAQGHPNGIRSFDFA